jgi:hypothetical protein
VNDKRYAGGVAAAAACVVAIAVLTSNTRDVSGADAVPGAQPEGGEKSVETEVLELGAKVLQTDAPVEGMDVYLVGFHPLKEDPSHQMEAHHFCRQVNADFAQCALFDGNDETANLNGIEYIISEKLFESLPEDEKQFWHPHNYEILSGQLVAPGVPAVAEHELMEGKMNSYGKTWHVWNTGSMGEHADELPLGEPKLAWSFNRDGEAKAGLVERRDRALGVDTDEIRERRRDLVSLARPQTGVDALKGKFAGETSPIPGVVDENAAAPGAASADD